MQGEMVAILGAMLHKVTYLKTLPCWKSDISWEAYFPKKQVGFTFGRKYETWHDGVF